MTEYKDTVFMQSRHRQHHAGHCGSILRKEGKRPWIGWVAVHLPIQRMELYHKPAAFSAWPRSSIRSFTSSIPTLSRKKPPWNSSG